jgi:hypothetical protein
VQVPLSPLSTVGSIAQNGEAVYTLAKDGDGRPHSYPRQKAAGG